MLITANSASLLLLKEVREWVDLLAGMHYEDFTNLAHLPKLSVYSRRYGSKAHKEAKEAYVFKWSTSFEAKNRVFLRGRSS